MDTIFWPLEAGSIVLSNRIVMAPLTRCRAGEAHMPNPLMAEYYAQRASAGLIIAEATMAIAGNSAFWKEPGIYSEAQVAAWRQVTDAVHARGGKIVLQIWHGGRACHPLLNGGITPVAPSELAIVGEEVHTPEGKQPYTVPRALETDEVPDIVAGFATAAENAISAGFDGVEIHGANGYLIDQFLRDGSNLRDDVYGGTRDARAKFLFDVLGAVCERIGSDRVGLRLSPLNGFNDMRDSDPIGLTAWLATRLGRFNLAYLHVMRADFKGEQHGDVLAAVREHYAGVVIANMGYTPEEATAAVGAGELDAVAFGVPFIANPDLVRRIELGAPLAQADPATFYTDGPAGYTDYPALEPETA